MAHLLRQARLLRHREGGSRVRSEFRETPQLTGLTRRQIGPLNGLVAPSSVCRQNSLSRHRARAVGYGSKTFFPYFQRAWRALLRYRLLVTMCNQETEPATATGLERPTKCWMLSAGPPGIAKTRITCSAGHRDDTGARVRSLVGGEFRERRVQVHESLAGHGVHHPRVWRGRW